MLLIVLGVIPSAGAEITPPVDTVIVSGDRTAVLKKIGTGGAASAGLPIGAPIIATPLDPADRARIAMDWSEVLPAEERIATVVRLGVTASGAALGVQIDTDPARLPTIDSENGKKVGLWLLVDPSFQFNAAFLGTGLQVGIPMLIRTDADPFQELERTMIVIVRQQ